MCHCTKNSEDTNQTYKSNNKNVFSPPIRASFFATNTIISGFCVSFGRVFHKGEVLSASTIMLLAAARVFPTL